LGIAAEAMIVCKNDLVMAALYNNDIDLAVDKQAA
jgi:hypothetical protein